MPRLTANCSLLPLLLCGSLIPVDAAHGRAQNGAVWEGPGVGNWWVSSNWNNNVIPNNVGGTTYLVITAPDPNGNGSGVHITINQTTTIDKMGIATFDTVHQANNTTFTVIGQTDNLGVTGLFGGGGTFSMEAAANSTDFRIAGGYMVVGGNATGTGLWLMSDSNNNRVYGMAPTDRLVVGDLYEIRGAGQIGVNQMRLTNYGYINGTNSNPLTIDLSGSDNFNLGVLEASAGGRLVIDGSTIDNTGGVIRSLDASLVDITGSSFVHNGEFTTEGSGVIRVISTASLADLLNTGHLVVNNNVSPIWYGTFTNTAQIDINAAANSTDVRLDSAEFTLTGSGVLNLSDSPNNRIYGVNAVRRLINDVDHTIRGSGQIGVNSNLNLTNDGVIQADQPTALTIDLVGSANLNNYIMQAINGGRLIFDGTTLDNANGVIQALDGSIVDLTGSSLVSGGELTTEGSGVIRAISTASLSDVHNTGHLVVNNNVSPILYGTITNDGQFDINAVANSTDVRLDSATVTLAGAGSLNLSNSINNRFYGVNALRRLVNGPNHTIRGSGQIGVNSNLNLTNGGTIQADQANALTIDLTGSTNLNPGLMQATDGAHLIFDGTTIDSAGGSIKALDSSFVDLTGSSFLFGGELATEGSGLIRFISTASISDLTLNGHVVVNNNVSPLLYGTITNNGQIDINAAANLTDVRIDAPVVTLAGTGVLNIGNNVNNRIYGANAVRRLVNGTGHTIRGSGQLGVNSNFNLTNNGSIVADQTVPMVIDVTNDFTNAGLLHLTGVGSLTINPGAFINATGGTILVDAGKTLVATNGLSMTGGALKGNGVFQGSVTNTGGAAAPGASVGHLTINGAYTQARNASLDVEIGGYVPFSQYDVLSVQGPASLNGKINVTFVNDFDPPIGTAYIIMDADSLSGAFTEVTGGEFDVIYRSHTVTIVYQGPKLPPPPPDCILADVDCNGVVDVDDLLAVIGAWGICPPAEKDPCAADVEPAPDGNGVVDVDDLLLVISNWT